MRTYLDKVLIDGQSCERDPFGWTLNSFDCDTVGVRGVTATDTDANRHKTQQKKERFGLAVSRHFRYLC